MTIAFYENPSISGASNILIFFYGEWPIRVLSYKWRDLSSSTMLFYLGLYLTFISEPLIELRLETNLPGYGISPPLSLLENGPLYILLGESLDGLC